MESCFGSFKMLSCDFAGDILVMLWFRVCSLRSSPCVNSPPTDQVGFEASGEAVRAFALSERGVKAAVARKFRATAAYLRGDLVRNNLFQF